MANEYRRLLSGQRLRKSTSSKRKIHEEALSDYGRVLYSPAFRRLQLKTQVFPLEDNATVRSRLTHSLEVAHIGHRIASRIVGENKKYFSTAETGPAFATFAETACLCHDLGNPPFGHFGETAIQDWFRSNASPIQSLIDPADTDIFSAQLLPDFLKFDGNPQGTRITLRLSRIPGDRHGLNLTYAQIASNIKYVATPSTTNKNKPFYKKAGAFFTEETLLGRVRAGLNLKNSQRHPVSLIMEAADDISYCLSDVEDAIEKKLLSDRTFFSELKKKTKTTPAAGALTKIGTQAKTFLQFKVDFSEHAVQTAAQLYKTHHQAIMNGSISEPLLEHSKELSALFNAFGDICKEHVYIAADTERLELAGHAAITDILDAFKPLLFCSRKQFEKSSEGKDLLRRLFNLLPRKHVEAYHDTLNDMNAALPECSSETVERFCRMHLLTDFVSGMTDRYAMDLHRTLTGQLAGHRV